MKFLNTIRQLNIFDWFGIYKPLLDSWHKNGLQILQVELPKQFDDPIPFRIELRINDKIPNSFISGYGEDTSEMRAFEKAVCELRERQVFLDKNHPLRRTTNGLAAHRFAILAKKSAQAELIERDAFLRHWLTKIPFQRIAIPNTQETQAFVNSLDKVNHIIHIFKTHLGVRPTIVVAIENKVTHGFVIGSSGINNEKAAINKALREAFYNLAMKRIEAVNWDIKDLFYHRNFWYERAQMPDWMRENALPTKKNCLPIKPNFEFEIFSSSPIPVVAAFSKQLIDLWVGDTPPHILERISNDYALSPNDALHPFP